MMVKESPFGKCFPLMPCFPCWARQDPFWDHSKNTNTNSSADGLSLTCSWSPCLGRIGSAGASVRWTPRGAGLSPPARALPAAPPAQRLDGDRDVGLLGYRYPCHTAFVVRFIYMNPFLFGCDPAFCMLYTCFLFFSESNSSREVDCKLAWPQYVYNTHISCLFHMIIRWCSKAFACPN